jgi:barstar (barnase inhibitor)
MSSDEAKLFSLEPPAFHVITAEAEAFANLHLQLQLRHPTAVIRSIRGRKCRTPQGWFDEVSAALQFPFYFGENWAAFEECIVDLDWIEGPSYLLMISDASQLFTEADAEDFGILVRILTTANVEWLTPNQYNPRDREPTPFHVLCQCRPDELESFSRRLVAADGACEIVNIPIVMR